MANAKILGIEWRNARRNVGFVLIENDIGEQSVRVGCAEPFSVDEEQDINMIVDYGSKLSFNEAKGFFPHIEEKKYKKN